MKKKIVGTLAIIITLLALPLANSIRLPSTIPPISAQSPGIVFECSPFVAVPGSVTIGASGTVRVMCPDSGALSLDGTLTPSFQLGVGYVNASIVFHTTPGNPCSFKFQTITAGTTIVPVGTLLNRTLTFSSSPTQGQLLSNVYDYCLQYVNAPSTGLAGFTITWT